MHVLTHNLVGVVPGSPKKPGVLAIVIGQISIQTLVSIKAKEGTGQDETHNLVMFYPKKSWLLEELLLHEPVHRLVKLSAQVPPGQLVTGLFIHFRVI
jgi:hypothetical protein